jgi:lipopolysaccharide biosynthesis regulator YciM
MRGLLRSQYMQEKWAEAVPNAEELLREKSVNADDRALAAMVQAKALQASGKYAEAITRWRNVVTAGNAAFAAEARYSIAECHFQLNDLKNAEKAAMETINRSGSYDFWITKAYILLGDVFFRQKDYFNAKATLQSVVDNSRNEELKAKAREKLEQVVREEKQNSRVGDGTP